MIVLSPIGDRYPDDDDPAIAYRMPAGVRAMEGTDGVPQAMITRSADGGVLHLRLALTWPPLADNERPAPVHDGRFRLRVHGPSADEAGEWRTAMVSGNTIVDRSVSLSAKEAAIAQHLGRRTGDVVDVEVECTVRGRGVSAPWLASTPLSTLKPRLAALLGSEAVPWEGVEAAVLGLGEDTFTWHPLVPDAIRLPRDTALRAIAALMASSVFTNTSAGWVISDDAPEQVHVRLDMPRPESAGIGLRWSFSEFLAAQANPERHLVDVAMPEPFAAAEISVFNDVPLADDGIRSIAVEYRTGGPSGRVRHEFLPGQPSAARLRFVRETVEELKLEWSAKATIVTAQGPAIHTVESRPSGLVLDLTPAVLGVVPVRVSAQPDVFAHVGALEVSIGARVLKLTREAPVAWAVGRQPPTIVAVAAVLPDGARADLGKLPLEGGGVVITTALLGLSDMTTVTIECADAVRAQLAYVAVQAEGHGWQTLDASQALSIPVRRTNRFTPPRLRYRTRHVARDGSGRTSVMAESNWRDHSGDTLSVSP